MRPSECEREFTHFTTLTFPQLREYDNPFNSEQPRRSWCVPNRLESFQQQ